MPDFLLPDLGEGLTEAEVVTWLVRVGDPVTTDQPVVEVETAKASVEVPIPFTGVVSALHAEPGTRVPVGSPLISVTGPDEPESAGPVLVGYGASPASATRPRGRPRHRPGFTPATSPDSSKRPPGSSESSAGTDGSPLNSDKGPPSPNGSPPGPHESSPGPGSNSNSASGQGPGSGVSPELVPPQDDPGPVVRVISPLARRVARDAGLDLRRVRGSGPDGLILRADIRRAVNERTADQQTSGEQTSGEQTSGEQTSGEQTADRPNRAGSASPDERSFPDRGFERIELLGIRRATAEKLARSRREIPEATIWVDADATAFLDARAVLTTDQAPVSLVALLARFVVAGLRRFPELNATVEDGTIHRHRAVHLGFAAQTGRGLLVPVVRDADRLPTRRLSGAIGELTRRARDGALTPADLTGGTITVNNYGVFGTDGAAAIINHPEAAILGLGRVVERPWVVRGQVVARRVTQLTLSFDHRVCDGGVAGGFLRYVADCVENPVVALGDL